MTAALLATLAAPAAVAQEENGPGTTVASGLNSPRGMTFGPDGHLYVTESGVGGDELCVDLPNPETGETVEYCFGYSAAVTRIDVGGDSPVQSVAFAGLPSVADAEGAEAGGPSDVSFSDAGEMFVVMGLGGPPDIRPTEFPELGTILALDVDGQTYSIEADLAAFEASNDPDAGQPGTEVDSNPNSLISNRSHVVADAGGNSILAVDDEGTVSLLAVFDISFVPPPPFLPPGDIPMQAVPTSVVEGPDGALYVGQLTGFPFPIGGANVYRIGEGGSLEVFAGGFTNIMDIGFGPDGSLFVLEIASNSLLDDNPMGSLVRVWPDGGRATVAEGLFFPGGLAVHPETGDAYVSLCGVCPGGGSVARFDTGIPAAEQVGVVDTTTGLWTLPGIDPFFYGVPGDVPFLGDWNGDGVDTPGLYRPSEGFAYIRNSNDTGGADLSWFMGNPGDIPLVGDWDGDGVDTFGVYRPSEGRVYLRNANTTGLADVSYFFGEPGDKPFAGDFDGDGVDTVGLHRESTGLVYFRNSQTTGVADSEFFWGDPGDEVFAGDWNQDRRDSVGLVRGASFLFRNTNTLGVADGQLDFPGGTPVAGRPIA